MVLPAVDDSARLKDILKGLEERVQGGREKLFKLQYQRSDLQFELKGLQEEKEVLDGCLSEAKEGEALVRKKVRQITAEFKRITDVRHKSTTTPSKADGLIKRTLILGRELFSILRDIEIEETARNAFECRVTRIQKELIEKAAERFQLQEKVILLQAYYEVDLEQNRQIYDEVHHLQKRSESFDAQIAMLTQWRNSLQNQITSANVALEDCRNTVPDPIATSPLLQKFDVERGILPVHQEQQQLSPPSRQASIAYSLASESPPFPQYSSHDSELQLSPSSYHPTPLQQQTQRTEFEQLGDSIHSRQLQLKPYVYPSVIPSQDFSAFSPALTKLELFAQSKQQDGDESEFRTFDDSRESFASDDSFLTMRTSRSVLFNLSSATTRSASDADYDGQEKEKEEAENETNHSTSSNTKESPSSFDYVLSQLHDVQAMKFQTESSSSTSKTPFGFEIWREVLPSEVSAAPSDLSKKNLKYEEKDGDEDAEMYNEKK